MSQRLTIEREPVSLIDDILIRPLKSVNREEKGNGAISYLFMPHININAISRQSKVGYFQHFIVCDKDISCS